MTPWLITCKSGREFIVYAKDAYRAVSQFVSCIPGETRVSVLPHIVAPTLADK